MTDQSVFQNNLENNSGTQDPVVPNTSVPSDSVFKDQLAAIKNERGEQKYDDIPKALDGLRNAQEHIPQLQSKLDVQEQELAALREAAAKHESVEDVVARLAASQANPNTPEVGLDEQKASALFEQLLTQREGALASQANQSTVQQELVTKFGSGEAANKAVIEKAKELGTTAEEIGKLSAQNPKMVLALFQTVSGAPSGSPPTPSVNSDSFITPKTEEGGLKRPEQSLLAGATYKEQLAYLKQIQAEVYKKFDVTT